MGRSGRVVKPRAAQAEVVSETTNVSTEKPLRPGQCRKFMRDELAKEFRGIVKGFVEEAKAGSCQHLKLVAELLDQQPKAKRRESGSRTMNRWLREMERGE